MWLVKTTQKILKEKTVAYTWDVLKNLSMCIKK